FARLPGRGDRERARRRVAPELLAYQRTPWLTLATPPETGEPALTPGEFEGAAAAMSDSNMSLASPGHAGSHDPSSTASIAAPAPRGSASPPSRCGPTLDAGNSRELVRPAADPPGQVHQHLVVRLARPLRDVERVIRFLHHAERGPRAEPLDHRPQQGQLG